MNDIRKYINLIESNLRIDESFKDAERKFSEVNDTQEVKQYIDKFKELTNKNIIKGEDKDIGKWIKLGWEQFKEFIDKSSTVTTKRQDTKKAKSDSIIVHDDENIMIVIPLTEKASCFYGKNTQWCTAATNSKNYFIDYFIEENMVLYYVFLKNTNEKFALAWNKIDKNIEYFDANDNSISKSEFHSQVPIDNIESKLSTWYTENKQKIENQIEILSIALLHTNGLYLKNIKDQTEEICIEAVKENGLALIYVKEQTEEICLEAVKQFPTVLKYVKNQTADICLEAINQNAFLLEYVKKQTKEICLEAVKQDAFALTYVKKQTKEICLEAVKRHGYALMYVKNQTEEICLEALRNRWHRTVYDMIDIPITGSFKEKIDDMKRQYGELKKNV